MQAGTRIALCYIHKEAPFCRHSPKTGGLRDGSEMGIIPP